MVQPGVGDSPELIGTELIVTGDLGRLPDNPGQVLEGLVDLGQVEMRERAPPPGVGVIGFEGDSLFQPFLRIVESVGKESDAAELEDCRIILGILRGDLRVDLAGLGKFAKREQPIGSLAVRLRRRYGGAVCAALPANRDQRR